jgi:phosphosulfolactate phosphohydrolase-like enzyme
VPGFDLGNSPREYSCAICKGRTLVPRTPYTDVVLDVSLRVKRVAGRTLIPA